MKFKNNKFIISYVKVKVRNITTMSAATTIVGLVTILPLAACTLLAICFYYIGANPSKTSYSVDQISHEFLKFLNEQIDSFEELTPRVMRRALGLNLVECYFRLSTIALECLSNSEISLISTYPQTEVLYSNLKTDY